MTKELSSRKIKHSQIILPVLIFIMLSIMLQMNMVLD
nr:MAG TPA: hypothetical protein [Caudoviricetes sp.]